MDGNDVESPRQDGLRHRRVEQVQADATEDTQPFVIPVQQVRPRPGGSLVRRVCIAGKYTTVALALLAAGACLAWVSEGPSVPCDVHRQTLEQAVADVCDVMCAAGEELYYMCHAGCMNDSSFLLDARMLYQCS